ncbi:putative reverse transcriptase domain-containing protein [Tanacetum coccineum]
MAGGNEGRVYVGPHPLCSKCKLYHVGPCTIKCRSCGKIGHLTRDCKPAVPAAVNQRALMVNQRSATCLEYGRQWNFKKDCPKLKNQNHENKPVIHEARGKAYAIGGGDANPRSNVVTDVSYTVKLADKRIVETNTVLRGCTIGLLGHPFNIDLMPVELGSFDVIIGERSDKGKKSTLSIISCIKTQKYMDKGCQVFLAQVTKKEAEVKSQEKRLEDVPIVQKFLEVFPEDLPGFPPTRQVEF